MDLLRCLAVAFATGATALVLSSCAMTEFAEVTNTHTGKLGVVPVSSWEPASFPSSVGLEMPELPTRVVRFQTTEGTWMSVDVSPDGKTIVFDLLGDLYQIPIEGGDAVPITSGRAWDQAPRFSPDGKMVYFVSDRKGHKNLWRLTLADHSLQQITRSKTDILGAPNWSEGGARLLVGVADREGTNPEVILHSIDPNTGAMTPIDPPTTPFVNRETNEILRHRWTAYSGVELSDGRVFFSESQPTPEDFGSTATRLIVFDRQSKTRTNVTPPHASYHEHKPLLSHDGNHVAYFRQYSDRTELRVMNLTTAQDFMPAFALHDAEYPGYLRRTESRPSYAFTPDDRSLIFWHAGKIRRVDLADGSMKTVPFRVIVEREVTTRVRLSAKQFDNEADTIRWPSLSADGKIMVFSAFGYVWVMDMPTGEARRLSSSGDIEYMPTISPDGQSVAYVSFASLGGDYGSGRLMVVDIDGEDHREILADAGVDYILPQWSQDGTMIAVIREAESRVPVFGWTPTQKGEFHEVASAASARNRASLFAYGRHVGFNASGDRLLFSYPRSVTETVLVAAELSGKGASTLAVGTPEIGGITPAPDLKRLALTRRDGSVWIVPFDVVEETTTVSSITREARSVSKIGGYYLKWSRSDQLTLGLGKEVYRYRPDDGELQSLSIKVPCAPPLPSPPLAFTGARLITMRDGADKGAVIESGVVVVVGAHITAIGPMNAVEIPAHARVIDAIGKTIIPGFLDTHYHSMMGRSVAASVLPDPENGDPTAITFGITSAWSPGGQLDDGVPAIADLQKAGRIVGPRMSHAAVGGVGYPYETLTSYASAVVAVTRRRALGVEVLKEYNAPTRQQRQWLLAAAYESELGIISHLETFEGTMTRVIDGYTGGDHPSLPDSFYRDVHELLRQTGFIWTPNLVIVRGTIGTRKDMQRAYCDAVIEWQEQVDLDAQVVNSICDFDKDRPAIAYDSLRISRIAKSIALAADEGATIGVSAHNKPGFNLHQEMWSLWKGGMSIEDVLQAAINVNARKLGLQEEIGTLDPGKRADFLVLDENPLENILNTLSLRYTVQNGVLYDSGAANRADLSKIAPAPGE